MKDWLRRSDEFSKRAVGIDRISDHAPAKENAAGPDSAARTTAGKAGRGGAQRAQCEAAKQDFQDGEIPRHAIDLARLIHANGGF